VREYSPQCLCLETVCDADFCENRDQETAHVGRATAKSIIVNIIMIAGCPLTWSSKMQTETALSTTRAEFIAFSEVLRTSIPVMNLTDELKED